MKRRLAAGRSGQSTVEYMLLVSVLVIGLGVAAYAFIPAFSEGTRGLGADASGLFDAGTQDGGGERR